LVLAYKGIIDNQFLIDDAYDIQTKKGVNSRISRS